MANAFETQVKSPSRSVRCQQSTALISGIPGMSTWADFIRPDYCVVLNEVVAATAGMRPHGSACGTVQGDRFPIKMNMPAAWMERQDSQITTSAWTTQINCAVLVAYPEFANIDQVKVGQYLYKDGAEFHRCQRSSGVTILGLSSRNLWRNGEGFETYCPVRRRHSITASDAASAFTSGSCTLR